MAVGRFFSLQPRLPRCSFPFYKLFYSIVSAKVSDTDTESVLLIRIKGSCPGNQFINIHRLILNFFEYEPLENKEINR